MKQMLVLAVVLMLGCSDMGTNPISTTDWVKLTEFNYARSGWLNFISIQAHIDGKPDSIMIVVHDAADATFITGNVQGGDGSIYARFEFQPGYVSSLPSRLNLSVYVKWPKNK